MTEHESYATTMEINGLAAAMLVSSFDPLTTRIVTGSDVAGVSNHLTTVIEECQAGGGYVEDIKLSTAALDQATVAVTALVMCRTPVDEDEETGI